MVEWKIWYYNGSTYSSDDGPPENAPRDGVEVVVVKSAAYGRIIWCRYEGYTWQNGAWVAHNNREGIQQYERLFPNPIVLNGFAMSDEQFLAIYHEALDDADVILPARTDLPSPDTPLPTRHRAYFFDDSEFPL